MNIFIYLTNYNFSKNSILILIYKINTILKGYILGLSCFYHDSAVALLKNGNIVFAAQENAFQGKHDSRFR